MGAAVIDPHEHHINQKVTNNVRDSGRDDAACLRSYLRRTNESSFSRVNVYRVDHEFR